MNSVTQNPMNAAQVLVVSEVLAIRHDVLAKTTREADVVVLGRKQMQLFPNGIVMLCSMYVAQHPTAFDYVGICVGVRR